MGRSSKWSVVLFVGICCGFFYQVFLGKIPFPGDLLVSEYSPWKYFSFLGYAPGGFPEKFQYFDVVRQLYPWTTFVIQSIHSLQIPLWNPYNFSGSPLLANSQSAVFYPLHLLYLFLPQVAAWTLLVMLQPLLASIFTYLYAQKIGISKMGSILASVAFGYSLFISVFLEYNTIGHVVLFLPLLLYVTEKLFEKKTYFFSVLFAVVVATSLFAGHIQITGFVLVFVFGYIVVHLLQRKQTIKNILFFSGLLLLGMGTAAIQLLPTFELIQHAARSTQAYGFLIEKLLIQPYQVILFFSPDIFGNPATKNYLLTDSYPGNAVYIGLIPFLFALFAIRFIRKNRLVLFYTISSIVLFIFFMHSPLTELFYRIHIPLFSTGSPTNAVFLLSFSLSILSGWGIGYAMERKKQAILLCLVLFAVFIAGVGFLHMSHIMVIYKNIFYTIGLFGVILALLLGWMIIPAKTQMIGILFILVTLIDLFYFFHKFNPFVSSQLVFPSSPILSILKDAPGIDRFFSYGNAVIPSNIATQYHLYDVNGYDPLYPKDYGLFMQSINGKIDTFSNNTRSDAAISTAYTAEDILHNKNLQKALALLDVRYVVSKDDPTTYLLPQSEFKMIYNTNGWQIFKFDSLPRAFIAYKADTYTSDREFVGKFYSDTFNPRTTLLFKNGLTSYPKGNGSVDIASYTPNKIILKTESSGPGYLFLSDTYFPGWDAWVDSTRVPILEADYAFRAIKIPSGKHIVKFAYQPASFSAGLTLTILSLVAIGGLYFLFKKKYL